MPEIKTTPITKCELCGSETFNHVVSIKDYEYWTTDQTFRIVRCLECKHTWLYDRPKASELRRIYSPENSNYTKFSESIGSFRFKLKRQMQYRKLAALLRTLPKDAKVIEIGPGDGSLVREIRRHHPDFRIVCIDIITSIFDDLKTLNVETISDNVETVDLVRLAPDIVIITQVIEHVASPTRLLKNIYEALNSNGILFLETPNLGGLDYQLAGKYWGGWHAPKHWHIFTVSSIVSLLSELGFKIVKTRFILSTWNILHSFHFLLRYGHQQPLISRLFLLNSYFGSAIALILDWHQMFFKKQTSNIQVIAQKKTSKAQRDASSNQRATG